MADTFEEPKFKLEEISNTKEWLLDPRSKEQFLVSYENRFEVAWNTCDKNLSWNDTNQKKPEIILELQKPRNNRHEWSPMGNYLASILYDKGVLLSVVTSTSSETKSNGYKVIRQFAHPRVELIMFSPDERYLVTSSDDQRLVRIWDLYFGDKVFEIKDQEKVWPPIYWSHDGAYFAEMNENLLIIYDSSKMEILNKKAIKIDGIQKFSWSTSQNIIAYYIPEYLGKPASINLLEIPSKKALKTHAVFDVEDVYFNWHPQGEYLAIKIDRQVKLKEKKKKSEDSDPPLIIEKKKEIISNYDFVKMNEKGYPLVHLDIQEKVIFFIYIYLFLFLFIFIFYLFLLIFIYFYLFLSSFF